MMKNLLPPKTTNDNDDELEPSSSGSVGGKSGKPGGFSSISVKDDDVDQAHAYVNWTNGISMHISMSYILLYLCRLQHVSPSYRDAVGELIMSDNEVVRAAAPRKINLCREIVLKWL